MEKKIAVFDACGTITKTNNTFDFINYVLKKDKFFRFIIFKIFLLFSIIINYTKIYKLIKRDIIREWSIGLLKNFSVDLVGKRAKEYIEVISREYLNEEIIRMIDEEKKNKDKVMIVSSSINPPIKELAKILNIEYVSSELEEKEGRYTGKLKKDLLGGKEEALELSLYDLNYSSVYSDNIEDLNFMKSFGKSYFVVHDSNNKLLEENNNNFNFLYLNNYEYRNKDVGSINEKTVKWIYIPVIYYAVSRWHSSFFYHLFLKEIIPFTLIVYFFTNQELSNFFVIPLSFLVFYSVYEVGGLYNDLLAHKEKDGNGTLRIKSGIKINFALFLFIRIIFAAIILLFLFNLGYCSNIYILCLGLCLVAYIIHSLIKNNLRIVTFFLLKIFRKAVPLLVLVNSVNNNIFINIFLSFFLFDAPSEIYFYFLKRRNKVQLKKVRSFKVKLFLFEFLLALIIWIYFSMPIYFIVVVYFLILNIFNYLFVKEKNII